MHPRKSNLNSLKDLEHVLDCLWQEQEMVRLPIPSGIIDKHWSCSHIDKNMNYAAMMHYWINNI